MARQDETIRRMGYENMKAAAAFGADGDLTEFGLVGPGTFGDSWALVTHQGCDPDDPAAGSSGVEEFADEVSAWRAYRAAVDEESAARRAARGRIDAGQIPAFSGTSVDDAKAFFAGLAAVGGTFHADDSPDTIEDRSGNRLFTPEAAEKVRHAVGSFMAASRSWPDPDFIYSLAGEGRFAIEADYPGFVMDAGVPAAIGLGYVSMPGQALPTLVAHDCGAFVAIQAVPATGRISRSTFLVTPIEGAEFMPDGRVDLSRASLSGVAPVEAASLQGLDDAVSEAARAASAGPRA